VWLPIIEQYGPALIVECEHAIDLSRSLVIDWLKRYMYGNEHDGHKVAERVASTLSEHTLFKSHGRHIDRSQAKEIGLKITDLESDKILEDLVLSVFHATTHTFGATGAVKIIENQMANAYIKHQIVPTAIQRYEKMDKT